MVIRERDPWLLQQSLWPIRDRYYRQLEAAADDVMENSRFVGIRSKQLSATEIPRKYPHHCQGQALVSDNPRSKRIPFYRQIPQVGQYPGMALPCRSPWTFAKITHDGSVQLCYQFNIGNLRDQSFEEIWFGHAAQAVRDKVRTDRKICPACDYYRFCLNAEVDSENLANYFAGPLASIVDRVDFESGTIRELRRAA
jgi:radical SAM protein with 4Fe4S-binding SPASM domain